MCKYNIVEEHLQSESNVEQKVIYPLLTNPQTIGLGFRNIEIQSKFNLKKLQIEID